MFNILLVTINGELSSSRTISFTVIGNRIESVMDCTTEMLCLTSYCSSQQEVIQNKQIAIRLRNKFLILILLLILILIPKLGH